MPLRNLTIILISVVLSLVCYQKAQHGRYLSVLSDAMRLIETYYLEPVEERELFEHAMDGLVSGLDQYSAYISPEEFQRVEESLDQEFGGVGIEVEKESDEHPLIVLSPIFDAPAYRAGIRAGDAILEINGVPTVGMTLKDAVEHMRGKPGTQVQLKIQHADTEEAVDVTVTREIIVVDSVLGDTRQPDGSWDYHLAENPDIGYLRLATFGKHTAGELQAAIQEELDGDTPFRAIILDLRGNAGGLLDAAVEVCDMFLDEGVIVSTRGRDGEIRSSYSATPGTVIPNDLPVVVLVNKYSASAAEIVAACLQDYHRAVVIGTRTYGKGTVQNIFELEGGRSALKLTTAGYTRPSGKNIHRTADATEDDDWGVHPDPGFEVELTDEQLRAVAEQRRRRDVLVPITSKPEPEDSSEQPGEQKQGDEEVEDLQLRRAIEYLEKQLASASA